MRTADQRPRHQVRAGRRRGWSRSRARPLQHDLQHGPEHGRLVRIPRLPMERNLLVKAQGGEHLVLRAGGRNNVARDNAGGQAAGLLANTGGHRPPCRRRAATGGRPAGFDSIACRGLPLRRIADTAQYGCAMHLTVADLAMTGHAVEIAKWDALASVPASDASSMVAHRRLRGVRAAGQHDDRHRRVPRRPARARGARAGQRHGRDDDAAGAQRRAGHRDRHLAREHRVARRRAELHGVDDTIEFVVAAGEQLPLESDRFDVVVGKAVLHHLEVGASRPGAAPGASLRRARGLRRAARHQSRDRLRTRSPALPGEESSRRRRPLSYADIRAWEAPSPSPSIARCSCWRAVERAFGLRPRPRLRRADDWLLGRFPVLRRLCRYVVIKMVKQRPNRV